MAKLVTKIKYLKPTARQNAGGYARYIATREGVEKIDDTKKLEPPTDKQIKLIEKIKKDFPDSTEMHEYDDYIARPTLGNASDLISRAIENNSDEVQSSKTYADYIATRPRAERFGSHGLFTDDGVRVKLNEVSEELKEYEGNVWTVIVSLRREDAERLGYNHGERWRDMLRTQTQEMSEQFRIPMKNLKWFAAFHNESHHPHVHLMVYSSDSSEGYITPQGVERLRSSLAKEIFRQDLLSVYEKQTEHRDDLRSESKAVLSEIVERMNSGICDNPVLEEKLLLLSKRLSTLSGKKQYGYLKADVKDLVDSIVDELEKDDRIAALYDLWYKQREEVIRTYTDDLPERIPLSQNEEFKSVCNAVIMEAMNILYETEPEEPAEEKEIPTPEPSDAETESAEEPLTPKGKSSRMWNLYREAKGLLDRESENYEPTKAVELLIESAKLGCGVAKYRLGKMFLRGDDVAKDVDYALRWLEESVSEGNPFAEYLLGKTYLKGEDVTRDTDRADELLRRCAGRGNKYAEYTLGKALLDGELLPQDIPEAVRLLTASAEQGFPNAEYILGKLYCKGEIVPADLPKAIELLERAAEQGNTYAAYLAGKLRLTEDEVKDIEKAIRNFEIAAANGNDFAEYQLGKIYLYGRDTEQDMQKALEWLEKAANHGNQYALQLLHSIKNNRNWSAATGIIRLLHHVSRIIGDRMEAERKSGSSAVDRKLKRRIDEKKQAQGIKD